MRMRDIQNVRVKTELRKLTIIENRTMTPDQIAFEQLHINNLQLWVTSIAIFLGPLFGVIFTFWFQSRQEKKKQKYNLLLTLLGERKTLIISPQKAAALNTIDMIFHDNQAVVASWHKYYSELLVQPSQQREHAWLNLLSSMAEEVGYKSLKQTDLDKFYIPQGHVDSLDLQNETQKELLRVLKNSQSVGFARTENIL